MTLFSNGDVSAIFSAYPHDVQKRLLELRDLILITAAQVGVGQLEETLKWGQPSYLTSATKSGTTVRIDADSKFGCDYALYVNCQTRLIADCRELYPDLTYGGNRSVHFKVCEPFPIAPMRHFIELALTYHKRPKH